KPVREVQAADRGGIGVDQTPAEALRRPKATGRDLQAALQNVPAEVPVARNLDAQKLVADAALHAIGNDLLGAVPAIGVLTEFPGFRGEVNLRVEITLALETLLKIAPSFFQQVGIDSAFLVNGNELPDDAL